jgi:AsmA protein
MQEIHPTYEQTGAEETTHLPPHHRRRLLYVAFVALTLVVLLLIPPLISVNRFQRRIATSISDSLGRPVHLDRVTLNLLPLPGFTLENLVVGEDPAFGSEPIIRASSVRATLRLRSLWTRRVEFSTISFDEPSVNLVHTTNGKWNLESILLRASHISAAPTAQRKAGPAPRFPYIEATGARLNLKLDQEKTPVSLTEADFALWLPDPQQWHLRLKAHPARTDTNASDTGTLQVEGTLGRAASLSQVPINLTGEWRNVPLGEATRVLLGRDAGLRGEMTLSASAQGTVGNSTLQTRLRLNEARRADFIPDRTLTIDLQCLGTATDLFHAFNNVHCNWPPAASGAPLLAIAGDLPDIRQPRTATLEVVAPGLPAATLLEWLHVASSRVPADIVATGSLTGDIAYNPTSPAAASTRGWTGELQMTGASLINPHAGSTSLVVGDIALSSIAPAPTQPRNARHRPASPGGPSRPTTVSFPLGTTTNSLPSRSTMNGFLLPTSSLAVGPTTGGFLLAPTSLALGGKDPAILEGHFDATGYTLHLTGMASTARMLALAAALPQFGDGLAAVLPTNRATGPYRVDLTATRPWRGPQTWTDNTTHPTTPRLQHHPHR